jgi:iron(III) transport system substrate-binding protein
LAATALLAAPAVIGSASRSLAAAPLVIYDSLDVVGSAANASTAKTGISANKVEQGGTGGVLGKIASESDRPQYDMVWLEGSAVMERMAQPGIFGAHPDLGAKAA